MGLFSKYPALLDYKIGNKSVTGMDITVRSKIDSNTKNDRSAYIEYTVQDGETALILADRLYDNIDLYWVIYMFNDIIDPEEEWALDQVSLDTYINRIYEDPNGIHHYISASTGDIVDKDHVSYDRIPVLNWEYETQLNDKKRNVKLPVPEAVGQIVSEYNRLIQL